MGMIFRISVFFSSLIGFSFEPACANYLKECGDPYQKKKECGDAFEEVVRLLKRCNDLNALRKKWSKMTETHIVKEPQDRLKQLIEVSLKRLESWLPKNLADELQVEAYVAYAKYRKLRKKFCGNQVSELIKTSQGNQGGELIKAKIAEEILGHVKCGINISLQRDRNRRSRMIWVSRIAKDFEMLARELDGLDVRNENDTRQLVENVWLFKQLISEYGSNCGNESDEIENVWLVKQLMSDYESNCGNGSSESNCGNGSSESNVTFY